MTAPIRILLLEDNENDAELIQEYLRADRFVFDLIRAQTSAEFLTALESGNIDLILADYRLPSFDGLSALKLAQSVCPDLPFIFVSGTLGEELAVEALKIGATDYVLKTRLSRLGPSAGRALREAEDRAERKRAEEALRRSEAYLAEAQRLSHTGSFGWDFSTGEIFWSDETYRIYGVESTTKPTIALAMDRTHPADRDRLHRILDRIGNDRSSQFSGEFRIVMDDGAVKYIYAEGNNSAAQDQGTPFYVGAVTDITERRRIEWILREQANLLNLTHDAVFVRDMNNVITYWNRGAEALYGWTSEEAVGKAVSDLLTTVSSLPPDRIPEEVRSGGQWEVELIRTRKDGTQVAVASRRSLQRDALGNPIAALETSNDISQRRSAEEERERLRQVEADLAHINRVSMMGEMAASLSHEIKQPLAAAMLSAAICARSLDGEVPDIAAAAAMSSTVVKAVTRATEIVDHIRLLYKRETSQPEPVYLNEVITEMGILLEDLLKVHAISIRTELDPELPATTADRVQLQQVLLNLMLNAIEAMEGTGGTLTVASKRNDDGGVLVSVCDSGVGLPQGDPNHIFEAFFTTKSHGTGMGLSICRRIMEAHGGALWAGRNGEQGAIFCFSLPGQDANAAR